MEVKIVAHSRHPHFEKLEAISFQVRYWRPIHSEVMTHRAFGRNARSSRAVPVLTLLKEEIFIPDFGMNQPGMQASAEQVHPLLLEEWRRDWVNLAEITRSYVSKWTEQKMHKQWANRPLEWFGWIDVLITATDWANFYALRRHWMAQPELRLLADAMWEAKQASTPRLLEYGEWHLPYITEDERNNYKLELLLQLSTARCARLSYKPFDGNADHEAEIKRYLGLVGDSPVHASPAEHQLTPDQFYQISNGNGFDTIWRNPALHGNLRGFIQHRKMLNNECVNDDV